jgi:hypothetical protein
VNPITEEMCDSAAEAILCDRSNFDEISAFAQRNEVFARYLAVWLSPFRSVDLRQSNRFSVRTVAHYEGIPIGYHDNSDADDEKSAEHPSVHEVSWHESPRKSLGVHSFEWVSSLRLLAASTKSGSDSSYRSQALSLSASTPGTRLSDLRLQAASRDSYLLCPRLLFVRGVTIGRSYRSAAQGRGPSLSSGRLLLSLSSRACISLLEACQRRRS